jgi:hypothetical protein
VAEGVEEGEGPSLLFLTKMLLKGVEAEVEVVEQQLWVPFQAALPVLGVEVVAVAEVQKQEHLVSRLP